MILPGWVDYWSITIRKQKHKSWSKYSWSSSDNVLIEPGPMQWTQTVRWNLGWQVDHCWAVSCAPRATNFLLLLYFTKQWSGHYLLTNKAESQSISDYKIKARWQGAVGFQERQGCLYSLDYLTHIPHLPQPFPLSLPSEAKCGHQSSQEVSNWNTIKLLRITKHLKEIHIMKEWLKETLSK